jgi:hypothetical protein
MYITQDHGNSITVLCAKQLYVRPVLSSCLWHDDLNLFFVQGITSIIGSTATTFHHLDMAPPLPLSKQCCVECNVTVSKKQKLAMLHRFDLCLTWNLENGSKTKVKTMHRF